MEKETKRGLLYWISTPLSAVGAFVALAGLGVFAFFVGIHALYGETSPYAGLITYIVVPTFIIAGLVLIAIGIAWAWRRRSAGKPQRFPVVDVNDPHHRRGTLVLVIGGLIFLLLTAF